MTASLSGTGTWGAWLRNLHARANFIFYWWTIESWMSKPCNMALMNYTESNKKRTETSMNKIKGWSRDGRAKKYTNKICRDNRIHYTSPCLFFSIIMHLLMSTCLLSTLDLHVGDINGCFCTPQKASRSIFQSSVSSTSVTKIVSYYQQ